LFGENAQLCFCWKLSGIEANGRFAPLPDFALDQGDMGIVSATQNENHGLPLVLVFVGAMNTKVGQIVQASSKPVDAVIQTGSEGFTIKHRILSPSSFHPGMN
jgi:hypothetical protein